MITVAINPFVIGSLSFVLIFLILVFMILVLLGGEAALI